MQQSILELVDLNKGCQMGHKIQPIYKILVLLFLYKLRWKHTVLPFIEKITALMKVRCHFCGRIITSLAYTLHAVMPIKLDVTIIYMLMHAARIVYMV